jgi:starch-binding outer membrane protein, SusD/RagB family
MKRKILFPTLRIAFLLVMVFSCKEDFLETLPTGTANDALLATESGVNGLLIGAYAAIDGHSQGTWSGVSAGVSNWVWGGVCSDDATKGMKATNEVFINSLENSTVTPSNFYLSDKWSVNYDGVSRANDVLKVIPNCKPALAEATRNRLTAEARFIRAFIHFELKKVYNNIPYITEVGDPKLVSNTVDSWPLLEADLEFAAANLPPVQEEVGRATKWAAEALLAKIYIFQEKWNEAKPLLDDIIDNSGKSLMMNFGDNFNIANRNNNESVFEIQSAVNDGANQSTNGNYGDWGINPISVDGMSSCCGAYQPTQNLVNAFQVTGSGLPILDGVVPEFKNDMGLAFDQPFVQDTVTLVDPRLDLTVGRRGLPYLDHGIMRGSAWINLQSYGGPYLGKKGMYKKSEYLTYSTTIGWATGINANNYKAIRYAHILLWRAEVAAETGDLATATDLVNEIRLRANNQKLMGRTRTFVLTSQTGLNVDYNVPAANYLVSPYPATFPSVDYARKAIRMENRLEFAMEGHRRFDLVRWGIAAETINAYYAHDRTFRSLFAGVPPATFVANKNEYFPIPQTQIDLQPDVLVQNEGY